MTRNGSGSSGATRDGSAMHCRPYVRYADLFRQSVAPEHLWDSTRTGLTSLTSRGRWLSMKPSGRMFPEQELGEVELTPSRNQTNLTRGQRFPSLSQCVGVDGCRVLLGHKAGRCQSVRRKAIGMPGYPSRYHPARLTRTRTVVRALSGTHHLKAVAHACEARTEFDIVVGTTCLAWGYSLVASGLGSDPTGAARFLVGSAYPSTRENDCATTCLTSPKTGRTLNIANMAGGEDH